MAMAMASAVTASVLERPATDWQRINAVNTDDSLHWTAGAGIGAFKNATLGDFARLCGTQPEHPDEQAPRQSLTTPAQDAHTYHAARHPTGHGACAGRQN